MRGAFGCGRRGEEISLLLLKTLQKISKKTTMLIDDLKKPPREHPTVENPQKTLIKIL